MRKTTLLILIVAAAYSVAWTHARAFEAHSTAAAHDAPVPSPTSPRKIDEYGNIRWSDEKARLDNLAFELRRDTSPVGYLICYGGRRTYEGEAQWRCKRAANYLTKTQGIEASRIKTIDGGYRENLTVELWAIPADATPPMASPTVDPGEVRFVRGKTKGKPRRR